MTIVNKSIALKCPCIGTVQNISYFWTIIAVYSRCEVSQSSLDMSSYLVIKNKT